MRAEASSACDPSLASALQQWPQRGRRSPLTAERMGPAPAAKMLSNPLPSSELRTRNTKPSRIAPFFPPQAAAPKLPSPSGNFAGFRGRASDEFISLLTAAFLPDSLSVAACGFWRQGPRSGKRRCCEQSLCGNRVHRVATATRGHGRRNARPLRRRPGGTAGAGRACVRECPG